MATRTDIAKRLVQVIAEIEAAGDYQAEVFELTKLFTADHPQAVRDAVVALRDYYLLGGAMSFYQELIAEAVPDATPEQCREIEDIMRHDIFHSTLDWQTKRQLKAAARKAWKWLPITKQPFPTMEAEK